MRRRDFITLVGGVATAWPLASRAQAAGKTARIGYLAADTPLTAAGYAVFIDELRKNGFSVDENLIIKTVRIEQNAKQLFAQTAELARSGIDVLVAGGTEIALQAAIAASDTVPIVMLAISFDPIALGYVKSLAKPGGRITGIVSLQTELAKKQVELLTQAFPNKRLLSVFYDQISTQQFDAAELQARTLHLEIQSQKLDNPPYDFDAAFRKLAESAPQMLLVLSSPFFTPQRSHIAELAMQQRLPTMFIFKEYAQAGGLMSYGTDTQAIFRPLGFYVSKVLRGSKPSDLPVEQAAKFEFVVNLKTAKAIGVDLPTSILLRGARGVLAKCRCHFHRRH